MAGTISRKDREVLISEIQSRPAIWNDADPNYKSSVYVDKKWREIAQIMRRQVAEIKSKWKNLRSKMRKEVLKMPKTSSGDPVKGWKSSWEYFDMMYFLKNVILAAHAASSLTTCQNSEDESDGDTTMHIEEKPCELHSSLFDAPVLSPDSEHSHHSPVPSNRQNSPSKRKCSKRQYDQVDMERLELENKKIQILQQISEADKQFMQNATSTDYHFLMSLLPFMEHLTLSEKLDLREKLQKHVSDAYKKHEQMQSTSTSYNHEFSIGTQ
ncbi:unnamed protein product [Acanthoscelides obtectus]|uniref:Transcription factor Adf-1 n=1 Tax=Acanthoscelides obtectus TaxID=200917 RepID=A0A9P0KK57_ACAOB|nr:unnamed protein product [Acanthoscelides obtectus]CAK1667727.1 hypothetical protein AOBTE_LOCUS26011 [Acanthoscelides obtectus]